MSLLESLESKSLHWNLPEPTYNKSPLVTTDCRVVETISDGLREVHELRAIVAIRFSANQADYRNALTLARQQIAIEMFSDILKPVLRTKRAISDGLPREAMKELDAIQDLITKGER
jgi:hypothetical protein